MIECPLVACSDIAVLDKISNNVSLINVIGEMHVGGFPVAVPNIALVFILTRNEEDPGVAPISIVIMLGDEELNTLPFAVDFNGKLRANSVVRIQGAVFPRPGLISFIIMLEERELGRWEFEIDQRDFADSIELLDSRQEG